jgi:hypothetical protein
MAEIDVHEGVKAPHPRPQARNVTVTLTIARFRASALTARVKSVWTNLIDQPV